MEKEKCIEVLNALIQINEDRKEGYESAAHETEARDLKSLFFQLAQTSEGCKNELLNEVDKLGGIASQVHTTNGKFFRKWMDVKIALALDDRYTILKTCDQVEQLALDFYNKALNNSLEYLTLDHQYLLIKHLMLVNTADYKVKYLLDGLRAYAR